jgi:hypothetical protein
MSTEDDKDNTPKIIAEHRKRAGTAATTEAERKLLVQEIDKALKQTIDATGSAKPVLFVIQQEREGYKLNEWHIVEIDREAWTDTTRRRAEITGQVHVKYWIRNHGDAARKTVSECKYWPNVHSFKPNGSTLGPMKPVSPGKVDKLLQQFPERHFWYQNTINLASDIVTGPFHFGSGYTVPTNIWKILRNYAKDRNLYVGNLDRVVPLDKPDREYKNAAGMAAHAFLARLFEMPESFNG